MLAGRVDGAGTGGGRWVGFNTLVRPFRMSGRAVARACRSRGGRAVGEDTVRHPDSEPQREAAARAEGTRLDGAAGPPCRAGAGFASALGEAVIALAQLGEGRRVPAAREDGRAMSPPVAR